MTSAGEQLPEQDLEHYLRVLRTALADQDPDETSARAAAETYLAWLPPGARRQVIERWVADRVEMSPPAVLRGEGGRREWFEDYDPSQGYHWQRLRRYLVDERGRTETVIDSLDTTTDDILSMLEDPRPGGPRRFQVRGLVVGYVQSGKTANFSAVIAKAFDAGYQIVIVFSGLHNSLRRQTQLRLEDELGLVQETSTRPGVGRADADHQIGRMTQADTHGDFNQGTADANMLYSGGRTLLVMKKNASVLRRLDDWLDERSRIGPPVLVIDDEADQASINTGGNRPGSDTAAEEENEDPTETIDLDPADVDLPDGASAAGGLSRDQLAAETDPSVINGLLRGLLARMDRAAYIGYTATPFANVLIGHEDTDRLVGEDLYPRDFILSLPRPPGYVGAERLFGRTALNGEQDDVAALDVIRKVKDSEARPLLPRKGEPSPAHLPISLGEAILDFLLATAARDTRTGRQLAASMLIHTSQRTVHQDALAELVKARLAEVRQQWKYDRGTSTLRDDLAQRWEDFTRITTSLSPKRVMGFADIEPALDALIRSHLPVMVLHSHSGEELDYERNPHQRAVLIGGNKLSRGLTLEGLLVSYYVRPSNAYDTLLQMGRWFGYREDYVDLTRLYTTTTLSSNFRDLATYEEELRQEIRRYEQLHMTPTAFGPRIRRHPAMQITARNRMGSARTIIYNYAKTLQQTSAFNLSDPTWLQGNLTATQRLLTSLGPPDEAAEGDGRLTWKKVDWSSVVKFLEEYRTYEGSTRFVDSQVREYIHTQATQHHELVRWTVAVRGLSEHDPELGDENLGIVDGRRVACISRSRLATNPNSIGTLVNPVSANRRGDEDTDLSEEDRLAARISAADAGTYPLALRERRDPRYGLLLIYPISRHSRAAPSKEGDEAKTERRAELFDHPDRGHTVIGLAVSLPDSNSETAGMAYVVGSAGPAPT